MSGSKTLRIDDVVQLEVSEKPDGATEAYLHCDCGSSLIAADTAEKMVRMLERFIEAQP